MTHVEQAPDADALWARLRELTQARIGLGRAGDSLPTAAVLALKSAHAEARDAIHRPLDVAALSAELRERGLGEPVVVESQAQGRMDYLRRPDLGRLLASVAPLEPVASDGRPTLAIVIADGLSTRAVQEHAAEVAAAILDELGTEYHVAPPVVAQQARVALGDPVGEALGVDQVVVLIGERPGLSVADSLGAYVTHAPRSGRRDSERNCVSNIRPGGGLPPMVAAATIVRLLRGARELGRSGVDLKDEPAAIGSSPASEGVS